MALAYEITRRGLGGEPTEIACRSHPNCGWHLATTGRRRDDDAILVAMHAAHLVELAVPDRAASGHLRKRR